MSSGIPLCLFSTNSSLRYAHSAVRVIFPSPHEFVAHNLMEHSGITYPGMVSIGSAEDMTDLPLSQEHFDKLISLLHIANPKLINGIDYEILGEYAYPYLTIFRHEIEEVTEDSLADASAVSPEIVILAPMQYLPEERFVQVSAWLFDIPDEEQLEVVRHFVLLLSEEPSDPL